ncbi:MAG: multicopper oxidase family protein [Chloroflexi bacterium]|nr:multicopper oxidase family protein [Chloroflexota bacterium]
MGVNRRDFLKYAAAGAVGGYIALKLPTGTVMAHDRGGGSVIDPPPGGPFFDPVVMPNISATPGIVEVNMEMKIAPVYVNGVTANLMTYNGYSPAPTIRIKRGDFLKVNFKNSLPPTTQKNILGHTKNVTNLHTHGFHVSPADNRDNILLEFNPGDQFVFEYDSSKHPAGNLMFYHPHVHGRVAEQMWAGAAGALVVEDDISVLSGFETHVMVLKDIKLSGTEPDPYTEQDFEDGKEGNTVMVNGQVNPILPIKPGQVQRWQVVNASQARFYKLSLENHTLYLVGTDGGLLDKPYAVTSLLLSPGERADLLIKANQSANSYRFRSLPYDRGGNTQQTVTLMTLSYGGTPVSDSVPSSIDPNARRLNINPNSLPKKTLELNMGHGLEASINGLVFTMDNHLTISSNVGAYELWEVKNRSSMDHPFHQHVNAAQVISIDGGDSSYASLYTTIPAWKDTTIVPARGSMKMIVPVLDYTGATVFHCHIVEHEDIGMMGLWNIV